MDLRVALCVESNTKSAAKHVRRRQSIERWAEAVQREYCYASD